MRAARPATTLSGLLCLLLAGCGVELQESPEPIRVSAAAPQPPSRTTGPEVIEVYLVQRDRLVAVDRAVPSPTLRNALDALTAGPTRPELLAGKRTAVAAQGLTAKVREGNSRVAVVDVTQAFAAISGENQLLAAAQLVWTVTEVPGIQLVRLTVDGQQVEAPTDQGLVHRPVGRRAYDSVRPLDAPG